MNFRIVWKYWIFKISWKFTPTIEIKTISYWLKPNSLSTSDLEKMIKILRAKYVRLIVLCVPAFHMPCCLKYWPVFSDGRSPNCLSWLERIWGPSLCKISFVGLLDFSCNFITLLCKMIINEIHIVVLCLSNCKLLKVFLGLTLRLVTHEIQPFWNYVKPIWSCTNIITLTIDNQKIKWEFQNLSRG